MVEIFTYTFDAFYFCFSLKLILNQLLIFCTLIFKGKYLFTKTESLPISLKQSYGPFFATIVYANNITVDATINTFSSDISLISIDQTYVANTTI